MRYRIEETKRIGEVAISFAFEVDADGRDSNHEREQMLLLLQQQRDAWRKSLRQYDESGEREPFNAQ